MYSLHTLLHFVLFVNVRQLVEPCLRQPSFHLRINLASSQLFHIRRAIFIPDNLFSRVLCLVIIYLVHLSHAGPPALLHLLQASIPQRRHKLLYTRKVFPHVFPQKSHVCVPSRAHQLSWTQSLRATEGTTRAVIRTMRRLSTGRLASRSGGPFVKGGAGPRTIPGGTAVVTRAFHLGAGSGTSLGGSTRRSTPYRGHVQVFHWAPQL